MTPELAGRTAIVTGASRGIGFATARALHSSGANVVLTARTEEAARSAAAEIGPGALGMGAHATDDAAARACVDRTIETFGSLDILVNNAGTNPAFGPLLAQEHGRFTKTVDVNLWAPIRWTSLAVDAWMGANGGSVVNTASVGGLTPTPGMGVYNLTKAALIHLTRQLASELAPRVRVNAVAPGVVRTKLSETLWHESEDQVATGVALRRIGEPADVAQAIVFLASDRAGWITGETLLIDGGQLLGSGVPGSAPSNTGNAT
ncbi:SDR family oxidoreductase [Streptomyces sp. NPDC001928]|uniref:SDR family oxidoreductase n=1 Tax=Streptomyces sp. NPDC001928 TaxID=3154404 RepID=UPI0033279E6E